MALVSGTDTATDTVTGCWKGTVGTTYGSLWLAAAITEAEAEVKAETETEGAVLESGRLGRESDSGTWALASTAGCGDEDEDARDDVDDASPAAGEAAAVRL